MDFWVKRGGEWEGILTPQRRLNSIYHQLTYLKLLYVMRRLIWVYIAFSASLRANGKSDAIKLSFWG